MAHLRILTLLVLTALLTGCSTDSDKPMLSVSIEPQKTILSRIVGDKFDINVVLPSGENPETYDPKMQQRRDLARSQAYFTLGSMPFEGSVAKNAGDVKIVDTSKGINIITGTHEFTDGDGHHHEADPHIWTSPRNLKQMTQNMLNAVVNLDPDHADYYRTNADKLIAHLDSLDSSIAAKLQPVKGTAFVVWHPSLSYFARDYGLHQLAVGHENKETSPAQLRDFINEATEHGARVIFMQPDDTDAKIAGVNERLKLRTARINPMSADIEAQFNIIADELVKP